MSEYEVFRPKLNKPCHLAERKEARAAYNWFIESIPERIKGLKDFVNECGYPVLEGRDFLPVLNDFGVCSEIVGHEKLGPLELSLAIDINMYIGDLLVQKFDNLHWVFHTFGKSDVNYQCPVIMGFSKIRNKKYSIEFFRIIAGYGIRILEGEPKEDGLFIRLYDYQAKKA
ncbi:hypothetical protein [Profundibacter sp.]|uniref:hypothetical protein n=1 Tax=Profundibacter sp. TaxID=3101071 RepID=UPI003D0DF55B